jgi:predicted nucleic acid-binding protein
VTVGIVCDASALVALLLDGGSGGEWATDQVRGATVSAPAIARFETANAIRRLELAGRVSADQAAQAHADMLDLAIEAWPYELVAERVWELRANLSCYDASYVALAELLGARLATLDERIVRAPGVRCAVVSPAASRDAAPPE